MPNYYYQKGQVAVGILLALIIIGLTIIASGFYTIGTGNVGVKSTLSQVDAQEVEPGFHLKLPLFTSVEECSAKIVGIDLNDLTPKAADNLLLSDLDLTVFFSVTAENIAETLVKYSGGIGETSDGDCVAGHGLVYREARSVVYDVVSSIESLKMHKERDYMQQVIFEELANRLEEKDPGVFVIDRVVIRALNTDKSIEQSIRDAVANQKKLEAKSVEVDIANKNAEIEEARARGIAKANAIINSSLTREYLQHEFNEALKISAEKGNQIMVVPANMDGLINLHPAK